MKTKKKSTKKKKKKRFERVNKENRQKKNEDELKTVFEQLEFIKDYTESKNKVVSAVENYMTSI